ncbi:MAG: YbhB/YbcL family Raf kinase inhibitor-like protein [Candidatus Nanosalina sp.]
MKLSSPDFEDGGELPERFGYMEENVNPELKIQNVPEDAESLVLIMDDPDAVEPAGKIWVHWTLWGVAPDTKVISEDSSPGVEGTTDFRDTGYGGPNPPDGVHEYVFRLYALDSELGLKEGASREEIDEAMEEKVLEKDTLEASYPPEN